MKRAEIKKLIYKRYIEPTKQKEDIYAGIEIELPIINLNKEAVNFDLIHELTLKFKDHFNFKIKAKDENGNICAVENQVTKDIYTYDCSYNTIELSFGKEKNLHNVKERFEEYYKFIQDILNRQNHTLTGFGVNPYRKYNKHNPIPNGRYRMLYHHLCTYNRFSDEKNFHDMPDFGMFTSAAQIQLDVKFNDLISTINAFSKLEPLKAILFSNSVLNGENMELACSRDMLWENSMQGYNEKNFGMYYPLPQSIEELIDYMLKTSIYCTEQDGKYINFHPTVVTEFFKKDRVNGEYYDGGKYREITFKPQKEDLNYLRSFKFEDLTYRGTIEFRSVCCQPVNETMTVHAFYFGLVNQIDELNQIFEEDTLLFNKPYSLTELRKIFVKSYLPEFIEENELKKLLIKILDLASEGLKERGNNEEKFLKPLYDRAKSLENPAQRLIKHLNSGGKIEELIYEYGKL
jgi:glutamate--cysteine ligase